MKKSYFYPFADYYKQRFLDQGRVPDEIELRTIIVMFKVLLYKGTVWQFVTGAWRCEAVRGAFTKMVLDELEKNLASCPAPSQAKIMKLLREDGLICESGTATESGAAVNGKGKRRQSRNGGGAV